jgi:hypothetical protein
MAVPAVVVGGVVWHLVGGVVDKRRRSSEQKNVQQQQQGSITTHKRAGANASKALRSTSGGHLMPVKVQVLHTK